MTQDYQTQRYVLLPPRGVRARVEDDPEAYMAMTAMGGAVSTAPTLKVAFQGAPDLQVKVIDSVHEDGPKLVELSSSDLLNLRAQETGLRPVPLCEYEMLPATPARVSAPAGAATGPEIVLTVECAMTGAPLANAELVAYADYGNRVGATGHSDGQGKVHLRLGAGSIVLDRFYVRPPPTGYWGVFRSDFDIGPGTVVRLDPINLGNPDALRHHYGNSTSTDGIGVKIGVIDGGIDAHPDLLISGGHNTVRGEPAADYGDNGSGHGTHVAGIIAARGQPPAGLRGLAPGSDLHSYRVFGKDCDTTTNYEIVKALIYAVDDGCDLINLSLGRVDHDEVVADAIEDARYNGSVVISAAGNGGREPVVYPAAYDYSLAVSAVGIHGTYPAGSLHESEEAEPHGTGPFANYFLASFSNVGNQIDLAAPGVGILSTVPGGYAPRSGTSMACPAVTGVAARLLSKDPALHLPRNLSRGKEIASLVRKTATKIGLGYSQEGYGLLH